MKAHASARKTRTRRIMRKCLKMSNSAAMKPMVNPTANQIL